MQVWRNTVRLSFVIGIIALGGAVRLHYGGGQNSEDQFWCNLCLSVFTGSFITFITALVAYYVERKKALIKYREFTEDIICKLLALKPIAPNYQYKQETSKDICKHYQPLLKINWDKYITDFEETRYISHFPLFGSEFLKFNGIIDEEIKNKLNTIAEKFYIINQMFGNTKEGAWITKKFVEKLAIIQDIVFQEENPKQAPKFKRKFACDARVSSQKLYQKYIESQSERKTKIRMSRDCLIFGLFLNNDRAEIEGFFCSNNSEEIINRLGIGADIKKLLNIYDNNNEIKSLLINDDIKKRLKSSGCDRDEIEKELIEAVVKKLVKNYNRKGLDKALEAYYSETTKIEIQDFDRVDTEINFLNPPGYIV